MERRGGVIDRENTGDKILAAAVWLCNIREGEIMFYQMIPKAVREPTIHSGSKTSKSLTTLFLTG